MDWEVAYVLPSLKIRKAYESSLIAIAPYDDERVQDICKQYPNANKLLNCFIDNCGSKIEPAVLIVNIKAPESVWANEALVSFRNIVALSVILKGWADIRPQGTPLSPLFSNTFDFYPIVLGKNGGLIYQTPALTSYYSEEATFVGMPNNYVPQNSYFIPVYDTIIFNRLLKLWYQRFVSPGKNNFNSRKVFRSIETAYHALSVPVKNQTTLFDLGVNISLWVSSFEILAHPKNATVNQTAVIDLIGKYNWNERILKTRRYRARLSKTKIISVNLIQKLYKELYDTRNSFLHGNEVTSKNLFPFGDKRYGQIWTFAPIVYRTALFVFLNDLFPIRKESGFNFGEFAYEKCLLQLTREKDTN